MTASCWPERVCGFRTSKAKIYKPWDGKVTHYNLEKLWWDYAKLTPFYLELATKFVDETISDNDAEKQIRELNEKVKN